MLRALIAAPLSASERRRRIRRKALDEKATANSRRIRKSLNVGRRHSRSEAARPTLSRCKITPLAKISSIHNHCRASVRSSGPRIRSELQLMKNGHHAQGRVSSQPSLGCDQGTPKMRPSIRERTVLKVPDRMYKVMRVSPVNSAQCRRGISYTRDRSQETTIVTNGVPIIEPSNRHRGLREQPFSSSFAAAAAASSRRSDRIAPQTLPHCLYASST